MSRNFFMLVLTVVCVVGTMLVVGCENDNGGESSGDVSTTDVASSDVEPTAETPSQDYGSLEFRLTWDTADDFWMGVIEYPEGVDGGDFVGSYAERRVSKSLSNGPAGLYQVEVGFWSVSLADKHIRVDVYENGSYKTTIHDMTYTASEVAGGGAVVRPTYWNSEPD